MASFNKVTLIGRLTKNPEVKIANSGNKVSNFTLAVDRGFKKENDKTDFITITSFGKSAEFVENYLSKGMMIFVEGRLQIDNWQDEKGNWHNKSYVVSKNILMLEKKKDLAEEYQEKYIKDLDKVDYAEEELIDSDNLDIGNEEFPDFFPLDGDM
jgi:single-strand DNA-binding protein